jgi:type II secretory pathway component PulM
MTPRERLASQPAVVAAAFVVVVLALADAALYLRLVSVRGKVERQRALASEMLRIAEEWRTLRGGPGREVAAANALDPDAVKRIAGAHRLAGAIKATRRSEAEGEELLDLEFEGITREDLARFLNSVELSAPGVYTKDLSIWADAGKARLVNAKVQFAAYVASPSNS